MLLVVTVLPAALQPPGPRRATGLSPASVSNVVRELISDGIVDEAGSVDSDGGRPRALLEMAPGYGSIIGVDVGETRVRVEMFDMTMTVRASADYASTPATITIDRGRRPDPRPGWPACWRTAAVDPSAVLGAGIGVPGAVEQGRRAGDGVRAGLRLGRRPA